MIPQKENIAVSVKAKHGVRPKGIHTNAKQVNNLEFSLADYLPKKKGIDGELEAIKRKQKGVEIAIAQAKLEASEAELAALRVTASVKEKKNGSTAAAKEQHDGGSMASGTTKETATTRHSDIQILLDKLYGKDDSDSAEETSDGKRHKKKKSGLYKKADDEVTVPQKWPHLNLCLEYSSQNIGFHDLSLPPFVVGEIEIISVCTNESEKQSRIAFLKALMAASLQIF